MRFKPMKLGFSNCSIFETNGGNPFKFAPVTCSKQTVETSQDANSTTARNRFDRANFTNDFEIHRSKVNLGQSRRPNVLPLTCAAFTRQNTKTCKSLTTVARNGPRQLERPS